MAEKKSIFCPCLKEIERLRKEIDSLKACGRNLMGASSTYVSELESALREAHHGDKCASRYNTGKRVKDPRFNCDCYKKILNPKDQEAV